MSAVFFGLGYLLDKYFGTGVPCMVVATFIGAGAAIFWAYKRVSLTLNKLYHEEMTADNDDAEEKEKSEGENLS